MRELHSLFCFLKDSIFIEIEILIVFIMGYLAAGKDEDILVYIEYLEDLVGQNDQRINILWNGQRNLFSLLKPLLE